jgi:hypothetical protein
MLSASRDGAARLYDRRDASFAAVLTQSQREKPSEAITLPSVSVLDWRIAFSSAQILSFAQGRWQ